MVDSERQKPLTARKIVEIKVVAGTFSLFSAASWADFFLSLADMDFSLKMRSRKACLQGQAETHKSKHTHTSSTTSVTSSLHSATQHLIV